MHIRVSSQEIITKVYLEIGLNEKELETFKTILKYAQREIHRNMLVNTYDLERKLISQIEKELK